MNLNVIREVLGAVGDLGEAREAVPTRVVTDSRLAAAGDLFLCLAGERFDGHEFAAEAVAKGALAVVAERPPEGLLGGATPLLMVPDSLAALGRLARAHRGLSKAVVVGVTGSAGKTTVKEMLASVLATDGPTHKNERNFNNQVGLPMAILAAGGDEKYWVLEAGISRVGDMDDLGRALGPDLAVITNVGPAHAEGLGGAEQVARHKARLLAHLTKGGLGLVNLDYPELVDAAKAAGAPLKGFTSHGGGDPAMLTAAESVYVGEGRYLLKAGGQELETVFPFTGEYMAENLAAVAAVAVELGLGLESVVEGLEGFQPVEGRFACSLAGDWTVIDDAYNANPLSAKAALVAAREVANRQGNGGGVGGRLILAMGAMRELGEQAAALHRELGRTMAAVAPAVVFWRGEHFAEVRQGLVEGRFSGMLRQVEEPEEFTEAMRRLRPGGVVLFKGSRSLGMDRFAKALKKECAS